MNSTLKAQLAAIRERADQVLDGMAKPRDQLAKDAKALCALVERMDAKLTELNARPKPIFVDPIDRMFNDILGGRR
jgi:hypothetical protein